MVASKLAELANEVTEPPVRLVKTIGDAAMFVSPDAGPLVSTALSLIEAVQAADLPSLRAGVAIGTSLQRAGDYYGHAVNLASRVTGAARPDSVLCTAEVRDAAPDAFDWSFARRHRLKGMSDAVPLYRARRTQPGPEASEMLEAAQAPEPAEPPKAAAADKGAKAPKAPKAPKEAEKPKKKSKADRRRTRAAS